MPGFEAVTPDGPADKAGLKAGDIITRFNGTALGGVKGDDAEGSGPAQKLVELARKLEPGDTVEVEYRRDGSARKAKIVAQDLTPWGWRDRFRMEMPPGGTDFDARAAADAHDARRRPGRSPRVHGGRTGRAGSGNGLNPELGEYFGAKEGVLVLETPRDSTLPLKAGDVIVAIDGRTPTSEAHARRILRSYDGGETAKLEILRKQKKLTLSWKVPEREWKWKTREGKAR